MLPVVETHDREVYRVGQFVFDAEDDYVTVTRDTKGGIRSIGIYRYKNHEQACESAWRMAVKQSKV